MSEIPSPKELDKQSAIYLDGWVDLDSERWRQVDEDPALTKKWIAMLTKGPDAYLKLDSDGRIWGKARDGHWYPYHIECLNRKYGIRIPKKAAN
jgi:hypothetical protein